MAAFKCKMCGGDLLIEAGMSVCECEYCGTKQTVPNADNEKKMTLFARAGRLLRGCEFDKAAGVFETIVGEAKRMVELEHGPEFFEMDMSVLAIGNVAFVGFPGESFTDMGVAVKEAPGWDVILPTCLTNGWHGYFPMMDAYIEGGYEARTSRFKAGAAEKMVEAGLEMLNELKNK